MPALHQEFYSGLHDASGIPARQSWQRCSCGTLVGGGPDQTSKDL